MKTKEYRAALDQLGLRRASKATGDVLGLSVPSLQRIWAGRQAVPQPVAILLATYLAYDQLQNQKSLEPPQ